MKRKLYGIAALVLAVSLLTGCVGSLFTTKTYRLYDSFADRHRVGTEKQIVLDRLGVPRAWGDGQGNYQQMSNINDETFCEDLMGQTAIMWVYECYKYPDPADPYRLKITFDSQGKSVAAQMALVPGG